MLHLQEEIKLHLEFCKEWDLSPDAIENQEEDQGRCPSFYSYATNNAFSMHRVHKVCFWISFNFINLNMSRYVLDIGQSEDWLALQIALLPCLIGYGLIAQRLEKEKSTAVEGNKYWKWITNYVADDYVEAIKLGRELVEKEARKVSVSRVEELVEIFIRGTKLETGFWDMGLTDP